MSQKVKSIVGGVGLMGLSLLVVVLFVAWPVEHNVVTDAPLMLVEQGTLRATPPSLPEGGVEEMLQPIDIVPTSTPTSNDAMSASSTMLPVEAARDVSHNVIQEPVVDIDSYRIPVTTEGTVLEAMEVYRDSTDFVFTSTAYPGIGVFVETMGGRAPADNRYWMLYINGTTADIGASQARVEPGDIVEWKYEKSFY